MRDAIAKQQNAAQLPIEWHFEQWSREAQTQFVPRGLRLQSNKMQLNCTNKINGDRLVAVYFGNYSINSCSSSPRSVPVGASKQGKVQEPRYLCKRIHSYGTAM